MELAKHMNATAAHVARDVSEFEIAGLTPAPSRLVSVPRVAESPVSFECKLTQIIQLQGADGKKAQAWLTLGEVVAVHIDKAMIKDGVYQTGSGAPDRPCRPQGRLFRDQAGCHVRDGKAGLNATAAPRAVSNAVACLPEPRRGPAVIRRHCGSGEFYSISPYSCCEVSSDSCAFLLN